MGKPYAGFGPLLPRIRNAKGEYHLGSRQDVAMTETRQNSQVSEAPHCCPLPRQCPGKGVRVEVSASPESRGAVRSNAKAATGVFRQRIRTGSQGDANHISVALSIALHCCGNVPVRQLKSKSLQVQNHKGVKKAATRSCRQGMSSKAAAPYSSFMLHIALHCCGNVPVRELDPKPLHASNQGDQSKCRTNTIQGGNE